MFRNKIVLPANQCNKRVHIGYDRNGKESLSNSDAIKTRILFIHRPTYEKNKNTRFKKNIAN